MNFPLPEINGLGVAKRYRSIDSIGDTFMQTYA